MAEVNLNFPRAFLGSISRIKVWSEATFDALLKALEDQPQSSDVTQVARALEAIPTFDLAAGEGVQLITFLVSTRGLTRNLPMNVSEVSEAVSQAYLRQEKLNDVELPSLSSRVERLLSLQPIAIREKAESLLEDVPGRFETARVMSDLRPVFPDDNEVSDPWGFLLLHTLSLRYENRASGNSETLRIVVGDQDLRELIAVLERALQKSENLSAFGQTHALQLVSQSGRA